MAVSYNVSGYHQTVYISSTNRIAAYGTNSGNSYYFDIDISSLLLDGNWHLLNITRNNGVYKLYIDATYYASYSYSGVSANIYPMFIGNGFTGKMDNFRIYNRELTQAEITEIYNAKQ